MLAAVLVTACSSDEFSVSSGGGGGGGAAGASCAVPKHLTLTAACASCLEAGCCAAVTACDGDASCPACLANPASCGTGPFVALSGCAKAACPTECSFGGGAGGGGGSGNATAACLTFAGYAKLGDKGCDACTQTTCHSQQIVNVCGKNPADTCNANCGTNATCFCNCMVSQPAPCGSTVAETYTCFTTQCGGACN